MAKKIQTIFRVSRNEGDFFMAHKHALRNTSLTFKAKGILMYLLSKPDDWVMVLADLIKQSKDGKAGVRSGIAELREFRYIKKFPERDEKGMITRWINEVYEVPYPDTDYQDVGYQDVDKSTSGKSDTTNNDLTKNDKNTKNDKELTPPPPKGEPVIPLPDILDFPEFHTTWAEWTQYRKEKRNALKPTTIKKQYNFMAKQPHNAVAIMETSMLNGWTGLFNLKDNKPSRNGKRDVVTDDYVTRTYGGTG